MTGEISAYQLYKIAWTILDWLYPPTCGGCDKKGVRWCKLCAADTRLIPDPVCLFCGRGIKQKNQICGRCSSDRPAFKTARNWAYFDGPIRNALHRLKYKRDVSMGEVLARPLIQIARNLEWNVDLVIPVPLGVARKKERGYNQADLLARPIALAQKLRYRPDSMKRVRETQTQVGLSLAERKANVYRAFMGNERILSGKNLLLIDDVMTSGATLSSCSQAALAAGAREVYCLTLARAIDSRDIYRLA